MSKKFIINLQATIEMDATDDMNLHDGVVEFFEELTYLGTPLEIDYSIREERTGD